MDVHSSLITGVRVSQLPGIALKAIHTRPYGEINLSLSVVRLIRYSLPIFGSTADEKLEVRFRMGLRALSSLPRNTPNSILTPPPSLPARPSTLLLRIRQHGMSFCTPS